MNSNVGGKVVLFLVIVGACVSGYMRFNRQQATERFQNNTKQIQVKAAAIMQRQMAGEDVGDEAVKLFDEFLVEAERAGDEVGGRDAKALKAVVVSMRDLQKPLQTYNTVFAELMKKGGASPEGIKTEQDIDARIAILDRMSEANEKLDQAFKALPQRMRSEMQAAGLSQSEIDKNVSQIEVGQFEKVARIRQTDRDLIGAMKKQFEVLKREFGDWSLDADNSIVFKKDPAIAEFNRYFDQMQAAAALQEKLQRGVVGR